MSSQITTLLSAVLFLSTVVYAGNFTTIAQCKHWVSDAALKECLEDAYDFAQKNKDNLEDLEKAANYVAEFDHAGSARVYQMMVEKLGTKAGCEKSGVVGAGLRALRSGDEKDGKAGVFLANQCYPQMAEELRNMLGEKNDLLLKRACPILRKNNVLKGLLVKRCEPFK